MGAISSVVDTVSNAVSDIVSPVVDVASNVVKAVTSNPVAAIATAALTGGASTLLDAGLSGAADLIGGASAAADAAAAADTATGLASLPGSVNTAAEAFGAGAPAVDAGTSAIQAGLAANPTLPVTGSLANIPASSGGTLPSGGGLDTAAAKTGVSAAPAAVDPNVIGTTSNFATGQQTNAVLNPTTGVVTNVPTGVSLTGTTAPSTSGLSNVSNLLKSTATPAATPTNALPTSNSFTTNNYTDFLSSLQSSGIDSKTGRTLLTPSFLQTSAQQNPAQILGALKQLGPLAGYNPQLINAVRQNMAKGGQPVHPEAKPGEPIFRTGGPSHYVQGKGDGQSDDIPAMLADGEFVFDADTVSQLGNGSNKAGAEKLDRFREAIRRHKRSAPVDKIPPKAKKLTSYLKEADNG